MTNRALVLLFFAGVLCVVAGAPEGGPLGRFGMALVFASAFGICVNAFLSPPEDS